MSTAENAARAVGGILSVGWLCVGVVTAIAAKRVMRLKSAPPIIYAYAPPKLAVLMMIMVWVVMQVFFSLWWADPRAIVWRSIMVQTVVEGLCRPALFGALIVHWRTPLSSYVVSVDATPALSGSLQQLAHSGRQPFDPSPRHHDTTDDQHHAVVAMRPPPIPPPYASAAATPGKREVGSGGVHHRGPTLDHVVYSAATGGDGGEDPSSSSDPAVSPAVAVVPMHDDAAVQRRLRHLVVARSRVVVAIGLVSVWFTLHVAAAVAEGISTDANGGIAWCGTKEDSTATGICCVPLDGRSTDVVDKMANETSTTRDANTSWSSTACQSTPVATNTNNATMNITNGTTPSPLATNSSNSMNGCTAAITPAPTIVPKLVSSTFDRVKLHIVPSQLLELAAFGQDVVIVILWFLSARKHKRTLISKVAVRRFTPFMLATTLFLTTSAVTELPKVFASVRENGQAFSATFLLHEVSDLLVVTLIAFRAFRQRYVDVVTVGAIQPLPTSATERSYSAVM